jgi:hypothetical protein
VRQMIDASEYGSDWGQSVVFQSDWFGAVDNSQDNSYAVSARRRLERHNT